MIGAWTATFAVLFAVLSLPLAAEPVPLDTQLRQVAVFRDGTGFYVREGTLPQAPASVEIRPLHAAAQGSLWLAWSEGVELGGLVSHAVLVTETRVADTLSEILSANVGKRVRLELRGTQGQAVEGTLIAWPAATLPEVTGALTIAPLEHVTTTPALAVVKLADPADAVVALPPESVAWATILDAPQITVAETKRRLGVFCDLQAAPEGGIVSVSYLAKGISWAPSYLVDISDPAAATITAQALVRNDVEELQGVRMHVVSGYPHLPAMAAPNMFTQYSALLQAQVSETWRRMAYGGPTGPQGPAGPAGPADQPRARLEYLASDVYQPPDYGAAQQHLEAEDLHYYPLGEVTLPLAATGYFPLFTARAPYEHVFRWDIPDYIAEDGHYLSPAERKEPGQIVWHCLRLTNEMDYAWMTAPAQTIQEGRVLGQDTLPYTPRGAQALLKVAQARHIEAEEIELETARERNAAVYSGRHYDLVSVQGRLRLTGRWDRPAPMEIVKQLTGEVQEVSPEAQVERLGAGLQGFNPRSRLTWTLTLPPDAEIEITYQYRVYIRA
ncbi:MAG: hypothetical protein AB7Y46_16090 [Armatimonadota bacterium]